MVVSCDRYNQCTGWQHNITVLNLNYVLFISLRGRTLDRQIGAGTGHRHGHSEKRRGYQDTPILQRRKHRKTRFEAKIRDLLLKKNANLKKKKNLKISSEIVRHRVNNNAFCSRAQTTCWIAVDGIHKNLPRWTTYESPSIYSPKTAILLRCNTTM